MTHERLTAYLLRELTEEEAEQFEDQCFAHEKWPADLDAAERELIDAYLGNELGEDRRLRFEKNYLATDARKARVLTAQSLRQVLTRKPTKKEPSKGLWRKSLVLPAVVLLLVAIAIWLVSPAFPFVLGIRDTSIAITLKPGQDEKVGLPFPYDVLKIYLILPEPSPDTVSYRVQWMDAHGVRGDLKGEEGFRGAALLVRIPAAKLREGQYVLKVHEIYRNGTESHVSVNYYFTARKTLDTQ